MSARTTAAHVMVRDVNGGSTLRGSAVGRQGRLRDVPADRPPVKWTTTRLDAVESLAGSWSDHDSEMPAEDVIAVLSDCISDLRAEIGR